MNTTPVMASDRTYGRKKINRKIARPGKRRLSRTARNSENGICSASDSTMISRLFDTAVVKVSLLNAVT